MGTYRNVFTPVVQDDVEVTNIQLQEHRSIVARCDVALPCGITIFGVLLRSSSRGEFINMPSKMDSDGKWQPTVEITDTGLREKIEAQVKAAVSARTLTTGQGIVRGAL